MGIGRAIALGGLGRGLQAAADDYTTAQRVAAQDALAQRREDDSQQRDNIRLLTDVSRMGGYVGSLPSNYNPDGTPQTRFPMRPGSYVGQSTATTQQPYSSETNFSRPMKKIGTVGDKDVWVPADGMTPDAYERLQSKREQQAQKDQARASRRAAVGQFKYTHPGEGVLQLLDDPEQGDAILQTLVKQEEEADPAYVQRQVKIAGAKATAVEQGKLPGEKELKQTPGAPRPGAPNQAQIERRRTLDKNFTQSKLMLDNAQRQQKDINKALSGTDGYGGLRGKYANMGDDTSSVEGRQLAQQIANTSRDSANVANDVNLYRNRAKAYSDSSAMPNLGLQPANDSTPAPASAPQQTVTNASPNSPEALDYAKAAQDYQAAIKLFGQQKAQSLYVETIQHIARKYGHLQ